MFLLVFNAGSSTLKFTLVREQDLAEAAAGIIDWKSGPGRAGVRLHAAGREVCKAQADVGDFRQAVEHAMRLLSEHCLPAGVKRLAVTGCGHRLVHGGVHFHESVRIDEHVKKVVAELGALAPLHNPPALDVVAAAEQALPGVPHVAVFDTAFFAKMTPRAFLYPLPYEWYTDWGIRRFGFHGISHHYCALRVAELLPGGGGRRLITCHLGNGCSASAVYGNEVRATTMGFTPLEGLMMGTRSGSVDPGILLHLLGAGRLDAGGLDEALQRRAGLLGVSGLSGDVRTLEQAAGAGHARARLALTMFADRVRAVIGSLAVTLGGVDVLVFTAGIGEHAARLRGEICTGLECLGVVLDADKNADARADCDVARPESTARILVLHTREEELIAREVRALVRATTPVGDSPGA